MKKRILIVDDDKALNKINEKILMAAGMVAELHIVLNGKEALAYLHSRLDKNYPLPDIIILDLDMPVMGGFQFLEEFRKLSFPGKSRIEIVIFTASNSAKDREKAFAMGVKHYLSKPYLLRDFKDIVARQHAAEPDLFTGANIFRINGITKE